VLTLVKRPSALPNSRPALCTLVHWLVVVLQRHGRCTNEGVATAIALINLRPSFPSTAFCPLYGPLSPLKASVPSTALCPPVGPLSQLQPSVPSTALCPLFGPPPPPPLLPSVPFTALYPPFGLSVPSTAPCVLSVSSKALCPLIPSAALCPFYHLCPLSPLLKCRTDRYLNEKTNDAGTGPLPSKLKQSGIFWVHYQTEIMNTRMPMPVLVSSMQMPSYGYNWTGLQSTPRLRHSSHLSLSPLRRGATHDEDEPPLVLTSSSLCQAGSRHWHRGFPCGSYSKTTTSTSYSTLMCPY
jgi:hypothetical protein